jgi:hypothetical protein
VDLDPNHDSKSKIQAGQNVLIKVKKKKYHVGRTLWRADVILLDWSSRGLKISFNC